MQHTLFSTVLFLSAAVSATIALPAWRRRQWAGGQSLALLMAAVSLWSLAVGAEAVSIVPRTKIFWSQVEYIGYGLTGSLFLLFVLQYTGRAARVHRLVTAMLFVIPAATIALAWTNPLHHLLWSGFTYIEATNVMVYLRGPWFWVFAGYTYLLSFCSIAVLVAAYGKACAHHRRLYATIAFSAVFPLLTGILYLLGWAPVRGMGISPLGFAATGSIISWGMLRQQLLGLVPVGRAILVEHMRDGVLVLDSNGRIADINPAAKRLLSSPPSLIAGSSIYTLFAGMPGIASLLEEIGEGSGEVSIPGERPCHLEVSVSPIRGRRSRGGRLVILRDITGQKLAAREREHMIAELQHALIHIQKLQGLLPICSVCKKIRDEHGDWHRIETYIRDHTGAEFSHGFCPECASKYYAAIVEPE